MSEDNNEHIIWTIKNGELDAVQSTFNSDVRTKIAWYINRSESIYFLQTQKVNKEIKGRYPIHYAADFGQLNVLKFLIKLGADVNVSIKAISRIPIDHIIPVFMYTYILTKLCTGVNNGVMDTYIHALNFCSWCTMYKKCR